MADPFFQQQSGAMHEFQPDSDIALTEAGGSVNRRVSPRLRELSDKTGSIPGRFPPRHDISHLHWGQGKGASRVHGKSHQFF
jgi:hypothetical protein